MLVIDLYGANLFMATSIAGPLGAIGSAHLVSGVVIKNGVPTGARIGGQVANTRFTLLGYLVKDQ